MYSGKIAVPPGEGGIVNINKHNSSLFNEFVCKLGFFWYEWTSLKRE
jgi:hypothetical protein